MSTALVPILDSVLGAHRPYAKGEYYYTCPFCHHGNPKLAINVLKRQWHCWHCEASGRNLLWLVRKVGGSSRIQQELLDILGESGPKTTLVADDMVRLPDEFQSIADAPKSIAKRRASAYLQSRGITSVDVQRYNIGFCTSGLYEGRIIIPSYDMSGMLNYFIARDYTGTNPYKYRNPPTSKNVVAFESYLNFDYPLTLVEGVFDAITTQYNAVPLLGSTIMSKLKGRLIAARVPVYLALDNDALKKATKIADVLLRESVPVWYVPLAGKDPADIGFAGMRALMRQATPLSFSSLINLRLSLL